MILNKRDCCPSPIKQHNDISVSLHIKLKKQGLVPSLVFAVVVLAFFTTNDFLSMHPRGCKSHFCPSGVHLKGKFHILNPRYGTGMVPTLRQRNSHQN